MRAPCWPALLAVIPVQEIPHDVDDAEEIGRAISNKKAADRILRGLPPEPTADENASWESPQENGLSHNEWLHYWEERQFASKIDDELGSRSSKAETLEYIQNLLRDGALDAIVHRGALSSMANRWVLADAYATSLTSYKITGTKPDGTVDRAYLSGRALILDYNLNLLAVLHRRRGFDPRNVSTPGVGRGVYLSILVNVVIGTYIEKIELLIHVLYEQDLIGFVI